MLAVIRRKWSGLTRLSRRRQRALLISLVLLLAFIVALLIWAGRDPSGNVALVPVGPSTTAATAPPPASPSPSPSRSTKAAHGDNGASGGSLVLPPFPNGNNLDGAAHGIHSVTFVVTSDKAILQMVYAVRGGTPPNGYRTYIKAPLYITETAHGDGIVGEIAAQASPGATTTTCTLYVDGVQRSSRTVKGPFAVAFCVG